MFKKLLFLSLITLLFSACASKEEMPCSHSLTHATKHMKEAKKLDLLIRELDMVIYNRTKSELQRDDMRRRYARTLSDILTQLSADLSKVNKHELQETLPSIDYLKFQTLNHKLNNSARTIKKSADLYELEKLPQQLEDLERTCTACHTYINKRCVLGKDRE